MHARAHIADVSLREVTAENLAAVLALDAAEGQRAFVASNAKSIAEAHFHPEAWFRTIYAARRRSASSCCTTRAFAQTLASLGTTSFGG